MKSTAVLLRHGESIWNSENRFTGWTAVELSERGIAESPSAGRILADQAQLFDAAITSVLKRAIRTAWIARDGISDADIPELDIPTGIPLVYEFDACLQILGRHYLDDLDQISSMPEIAASQAGIQAT